MDPTELFEGSFGSSYLMPEEVILQFSEFNVSDAVKLGEIALNLGT